MRAEERKEATASIASGRVVADGGMIIGGGRADV